MQGPARTTASPAAHLNVCETVVLCCFPDFPKTAFQSWTMKIRTLSSWSSPTRRFLPQSIYQIILQTCVFKPPKHHSIHTVSDCWQRVPAKQRYPVALEDRQWRRRRNPKPKVRRKPRPRPRQPQRWVLHQKHPPAKRKFRRQLGMHTRLQGKASWTSFFAYIGLVSFCTYKYVCLRILTCIRVRMHLLQVCKYMSVDVCIQCVHVDACIYVRSMYICRYMFVGIWICTCLVFRYARVNTSKNTSNQNELRLGDTKMQRNEKEKRLI